MFTLEDREICKNCEYKEICAGECEKIIKAYKELEIITNGIKVLETNGVNDDTYYVIAKTDFLKGSYKNLLDEYISKSKVREIIQKYYDEYEKEKEYRYTLDVEDEQRILRKIEKELLNERR